MTFNLASVANWRVINAAKQQQMDIYSVLENARQFMHDYSISDIVYAEMTGIYCKLYYIKKVP